MRRRIILENGVKTEKVTVQVTMSDGASAQGITVTINGNATTTNADGLAYGEVPYDTTYSVVFSQKNSTYSTPATQSFTANQETRPVNATYTKYYETCNVTSNVSTTINVRFNSTNHTKTGTSYSVKVPYGTSYSVSGSAVTNYTSPATQNFTANKSSRSVNLSYTRQTGSVHLYANQNVYWLQVTVHVSDGTEQTVYPTGTTLTLNAGDQYYITYTASTNSCQGINTAPMEGQWVTVSANTTSYVYFNVYDNGTPRLHAYCPVDKGKYVCYALTKNGSVTLGHVYEGDNYYNLESLIGVYVYDFRCGVYASNSVYREIQCGDSFDWNIPA